MTKDEYLQQSMQSLFDNPQPEQLSPETRAFIEREAKKNIALAMLRGAAVHGTENLLATPGKLMTPLNLALIAGTGGTYLPLYLYKRLMFDALAGAGRYGDSRSRYKYMDNQLKDMEKTGASINYGGVLGRKVADEAKHMSGYNVQVMPTSIDDPYTRGTFSGKLRDDDTKALLYKKILERMEEQNPELKDVVVHLGAGRNLQDSLRSVFNNRLGLGMKLRTILGLPGRLASSTVDNRERGDNYDAASNAVTIYGDDPGVFTHELGHAIYYNQKKGRELDKRIKERMTDMSADEAAANRASSDSIAKAFADSPKLLSALQTLRLRALPRGYYTYNQEYDRDKGWVNKYKDKPLAELARDANIDHDAILDEHMAMPSTDLIKLMREELVK